MNLSGFDVLAGLTAEYLAHLRSLSPWPLGSRQDAAQLFASWPDSSAFSRRAVIHVSRDPLDTCLSCYFQEFSASHSYAYDLTLLGRYYRQYERLMEHWKRVLDLPMLDVRYEDLVNDQAGTSRLMIEFCGLEWDDRCCVSMRPGAMCHAQFRAGQAAHVQAVG